MTMLTMTEIISKSTFEMARDFIHNFLYLFIISCLGVLEVDGQTTYFPYVRSKNNSCTITKIELTETETIVTIQVPGKGIYSSVSFSSNTVLVPSEAWDINESRRWNLEITGFPADLQLYAMALNNVRKGRELLSEKGWLIRSLGRDKLDITYTLNKKAPTSYCFELHFDRLPHGIKDVYIRELVSNGWEWVGIKINNPYPTVPNIGITEEQMKELIDETNNGIVGIYEEMSGNNKYKLACVLIDGVYQLIYLANENNYKHWSIGDVKATLRPSATHGLFKADWYMANKTLNTDVYVTFDGSSMKTVIGGDESGYLKMYPTTQSGSNLYGSKEWSGTGFALKNGYVATNYHVVENAKSIQVQGINGNFSTKYKASVVATDKNNDLAVLRIDDPSFSGFGSVPYNVKTSQVDVGEEIFVLGYPLTVTMGDEIKLTTGVISSKTGFQGDVSLYQISAPVQPGNSGGPLFDHNGNLIGIVSAKHAGAENVGYAIKASYLKNLVESYISTSVMPTNNQVAGQPLTSQVKRLKNFVYMITCSNVESTDYSSSEQSNVESSSSVIDVSNPQITTATSDGLKIKRIQVTSSQTIVHCEFDNSKKHSGWVTISPNTYISYAGAKYTMTKAEGIPIEPARHYFQTASDRLYFRLIFPPLPKDATEFDLIESESSTWKFYGIRLK